VHKVQFQHEFHHPACSREKIYKLSLKLSHQKALWVLTGSVIARLTATATTSFHIFTLRIRCFVNEPMPLWCDRRGTWYSLLSEERKASWYRYRTDIVRFQFLKAKKHERSTNQNVRELASSNLIRLQIDKNRSALKLRNTFRHSWHNGWSVYLAQRLPKYGLKHNQGCRMVKKCHAGMIQLGVVYFHRYHCLSMSVCSVGTWEKSGLIMLY